MELVESVGLGPSICEALHTLLLQFGTTWSVHRILQGAGMGAGDSAGVNFGRTQRSRVGV